MKDIIQHKMIGSQTTIKKHNQILKPKTILILTQNHKNKLKIQKRQKMSSIKTI